MLTEIKVDIDQFIVIHFVLPFLVFLLLFAGLEFIQLDLWISRHFYNTALNNWPYKEHWLTEKVLHSGGQYFTILITAVLFFSLLISFLPNFGLYWYRRHLSFLFLASICGPIIIILLKSSTHIYCPWSLSLFGGDKPYVRLFDYASKSLKVGYCFPGAHAGTGFAFVSIYFFLFAVKQEYKVYGLVFGLILGGAFGVAQEMRGAHFLSHDVFSLAVCWFSSLVLFILFFRKQLQWV